MTAGGPPQPPYPQPTPAPPKRRAAGIAWLVAGLVAVGTTFVDVFYTYATLGGPRVFESTTRFWGQKLTSNGRTFEVTVYEGIEVVVGAAALLLAGVLVFMSKHKSAIVAGAFGTGMALSTTLSFFQAQLSDRPDITTVLELGVWLMVLVTLIGVVGLVVALAGSPRSRPAPPPGYGAAPPPPPRRWEPPTPRYGIPVQQPEPVQQQQQRPEPVGTHLDEPERTTTLKPENPPPPPPGPDAISRKLDGDDQ